MRTGAHCLGVGNWGRRHFALMVALVLAAGGVAAQEGGYERSSKGTRWLESLAGGLKIKVLVEAANLGSGELEVGEITFPGETPGGEHLHESTEIFYVVSGVLDHIVNGETHVLEPGMVGIVKPGDRVIHRVRDKEPVRAVVIWAPGGEAERIGRVFRSVPIE